MGERIIIKWITSREKKKYMRLKPPVDFVVSMTEEEALIRKTVAEKTDGITFETEGVNSVGDTIGRTTVEKSGLDLFKFNNTPEMKAFLRRR
ncbi:hypothetical protein ISR94_01560 [Candidatus Microgenomates bacterium]|nr:hypothetical protein [Candidatus Microgenomates bacterium]